MNEHDFEIKIQGPLRLYFKIISYSRAWMAMQDMQFWKILQTKLGMQ